MNKKALKDEETLQYKIEKEKPIGSSHMVSGFIMFILAIVLVAIIILFVHSKLPEKEGKDQTATMLSTGIIV